jgi:hypothetical protein
MAQDEAIRHVHERRFCAPYEDLLSVPINQESQNRKKNAPE